MPSLIKMRKYNSNHPSGVIAYGFAATGIIIQFAKGGYYLYDLEKPGPAHVNNMVMLAQKGAGLSTYISQHPEVRDNYKTKEDSLQDLLKMLS